MKIFGSFYSEKVIFYKNKKNSIITQQKKRLAIHTTSDDNAEGGGGGFGTGRSKTGRSHLDPTHLFFAIPKLVSFKKLYRTGRRWENS